MREERHNRGKLRKRRAVGENVGAAEVAMGKRGYEDTEGGRCRKYLRAEVDVEEEEGLWEIDSRYGEYLYETWMWGSMRESRFAFPDVVM